MRDDVDMVWIPAGSFLRGSEPGELDWLSTRYTGLSRDWFTHEIGARSIWTSGFHIDLVPVTNGRYRRFVEDGGYVRPELWLPEGWGWLSRARRDAPKFWSSPRWAGWTEDDLPVVGICWYEADAYARWAGKRLPSEAEWERAARGADGRRYPWGQELRPGLCNSADHWLGREIRDFADWEQGYFWQRPWRSRVLTTPVGSFPEGASPYGLLDMGGNVWEWCSDWYGADFYAAAADTDPRGPAAGEDRVCRGGSFGYFGWSVRTTERGHHAPSHCSLGIGFRCARDPG